MSVRDSAKESGAFLTIGELADQLGLPTHILRYWETRFPQLKPLTRAGNRRYYRREDVALAHRINGLLNERGFTIKGAQKALAEGVVPAGDAPVEPRVTPPQMPNPTGTANFAELKKIRDRLAAALADG